MKLRNQILSLLTLIVLIFFSSACQKYIETQSNLQEFRKNYDEVAPPIPPIVRPKRKKRVPINLSGHRYAPPTYQESSQQSEAESEDMDTLPPPPPTEEPRKAVSFWAAKVLEWAQDYEAIGIETRDVRLNKIAEKYSHRAWDWSKRAYKIQDLSFEDASLQVQTWLDVENPPDLPEKPKYFRGQDAFEEIAKAVRTYEKFQDKVCATAQGVKLPVSLGYIDYAIDLLEQKNYVRARTAAQKAYYFLGGKDPDKLDCSDIDQDRIPVPIDECPVSPEDIDQFEDEDGCPEEDNDQDGILDKQDQCPLEPEVVNQFQDNDGCPDSIESMIGVFITAEGDLIHPEYFFDTLRYVQSGQNNKLRYIVIVSSNGVVEAEKEQLETLRLQNLRNEFKIVQQDFTIPLRWITRTSYERDIGKLPDGQVLILGMNPKWKKR